MVDSSKWDVVRSYYEYIDDGAYDELFSLFSSDIVYHRPGQPPIEGKEEFKNFYLKDRPLEEGTHTVNAILVDGDTVAVRGTFEGLQDGAPIRFKWADFHEFDEAGKIHRRYTYTDRDEV